MEQAPEMRNPAGQGEVREIEIQSSKELNTSGKGRTPQARWRERNPLASWCHRATASAIKRGILERLPCAVCGSEETDAHHVGPYTEPLNVLFLCRLHHKAEHRRLKCEGAG